MTETPREFYDVVVLGAETGTLVAAALLGARGFRVLVVGQGSARPSYALGSLDLPTSATGPVPLTAPSVARVVAELGLQSVLRRDAITASPSFQVVLPTQRLNLGSDLTALEREVGREFPGLAPVASSAVARALRTNELLERLLTRTSGWPPVRWADRYRARASARRALVGATESGPDPLAALEPSHPLRVLFAAPVAAATRVDPALASDAVCHRLLATWLSGPHGLAGGRTRLHAELEHAIARFGGEVRPGDRAESIRTERGAIRGVRLCGGSAPIGCDGLVSGLSLTSTAELLEERGPIEELFESRGEPEPVLFRHTTNVVLRDEGIPEGMGPHLFCVADPAAPLRSGNFVHVERGPGPVDGSTVLTLTRLLLHAELGDDGAPASLESERSVAALGSVIPFLDRHLLFYHSPHDAAPPRGPSPPPVSPRGSTPPSSLVPLVPLLRAPVTDELGLAALPVRTPVRRLVLCGDQVLPSLGLEGSFLAAEAAVLVVQGQDARGGKLRRRSWRPAAR